MPTRSRLPLRGRVALVTGGSRRIGREIVLALAAAGADVAIHANEGMRAAETLARRVRRGGRRAIAVEGDLTDAAACRRLPREVARALGRLDVLVNNAALFEPTDPRGADEAAWDRLMAVNARAPWLLTSASARLLQASRGCVVNLACASVFSPWPSFLPYSASKAALAALTQGFAKALAPRVRVNAVAPGPILPAAGTTPSRDAAAVRATLLKRWGRPADVAAAVVHLACADFVTGVVFPVDGGRHIA